MKRVQKIKKLSKAKYNLINTHYMVCVHVWCTCLGLTIGQMIIIANRLGANKLKEKK